MTAREQSTGPRQGADLHRGDVFGLLVLRLGIGGVLVWFGAAELHNPGAWAVFVPKLFDPVMVPLMFVHATALLVVGALLAAGMFHRLAAWLGGLILLAILGALAMNGSIDSVFVRDVGLACAAFGLALSPTARRLPGVDRWFGVRSKRGYVVPAVSYGVVLAALVGLLAATAVPSTGTSTAFNNLGGMGGLSTLGSKPAASGSSATAPSGLALGGSATLSSASSASGTCAPAGASSSAGTCSAPTSNGASSGVSALGGTLSSSGSAH